MHKKELNISKYQLLRSILIMLGFGGLSILLGSIRFYIPGLEGGGSDMREIGLLLSVIFIPHWVFMLGVSFLASLSFPMTNLEVSTLSMHLTSGLFAWFFYTYIIKNVKSIYSQGGLWSVMVLVYYFLFLIPTLILVFYLYDVISASEILSRYKIIIYGYRFELFTSITVTTLFLVLHRISKILEVRNRELEISLRKSEESDRLKTAFLNSINHEIRTPLNGIMGFSNLITEPGITQEERIAYRNFIISNGNLLLSIVSDIIELSKIKTGQTELIVSPVSINELFDIIGTSYGQQAKDRKLEFQVVKASDDNDFIIHTDKSKLLQIINNLVNNAFKFTQEGLIRLYYLRNDDQVLFFIEDTGRGIDAADQHKIFEPFTKIENRDEKFLPGTGIGLSISKELVEILGGEITVASEPGKGSVFSFSVPFRKEQPEKLPAAI